MRVAARADVKSEDWKNAAISNSNFGELNLTLGNVETAIAAAVQAVNFADRSGDKLRIATRADLAEALHYSGEIVEAMRLFIEAEQIQVEYEPAYPLLYSNRGFRFCQLLLDQGQSAEVLRRATQTLTLSVKKGWLLNIGLDHLSLGQAHLPGSAEAPYHLNEAVAFLRRAGQLDYLPLGLLARGTPTDLHDAFRIATRSGMRLHLTDYHLASARLALLTGDRAQGRAHLKEAERLIEETGYNRRRLRIEQLSAQAAG